ncbi:hypothetical protein CC2G_005170 [Coprinopsis cinerea AmutBmut pab1-1]|nr:hypothetical protein CC2G_005170 [Coprinopsis cinerea AmutBmut pab1-1]
MALVDDHCVIRLLKKDPVALDAVEIVEWEDHETHDTGTGLAAGLDLEAFRRTQDLLSTEVQVEGNREALRRLMMEEIISLSFTLISKIIEFLSTFPSLKIAEIPH